MKQAYIRRPDPSIARCELSYIDRDPIDYKILLAKHDFYAAALRSLGFSVVLLPEIKNAPDGMFVEDTAVLLGSLAVICRPGAESRRHEVDSVAEVLRRDHELQMITGAATIDGGDVLVVGKEVFVGTGYRTNAEGFSQFAEICRPFGYRATAVNVGKCLHLKTGVTRLDDSTLLINRQWVDEGVFKKYRLIDIDPDELFAANVIADGTKVICSAQFPKTLALIAASGFEPVPVDSSEAAKAEAGLTCCSLLSLIS